MTSRNRSPNILSVAASTSRSPEWTGEFQLGCPDARVGATRRQRSRTSSTATWASPRKGSRATWAPPRAPPGPTAGRPTHHDPPRRSGRRIQTRKRQPPTHPALLAPRPGVRKPHPNPPPLLCSGQPVPSPSRAGQPRPHPASVGAGSHARGRRAADRDLAPPLRHRHCCIARGRRRRRRRRCGG